MLFWPSLAFCALLFLGFVLLLWLSAIDLKLRLLPDELTLALAVCGALFAWVGTPYTGPWYNPVLGLVVGGGSLMAVRAIANKIYGFETMGLGDIKLLAAGGLWIGLQGVIAAICAGAFAGVAHGLIVLLYQRLVLKKDTRFRDLTIPAGPGFCVGLMLVTIWQYYDIPLWRGMP